jgi:hypothetical protein
VRSTVCRPKPSLQCRAPLDDDTDQRLGRCSGAGEAARWPAMCRMSGSWGALPGSDRLGRLPPSHRSIRLPRRDRGPSGPITRSATEHLRPAAARPRSVPAGGGEAVVAPAEPTPMDRHLHAVPPMRAESDHRGPDTQVIAFDIRHLRRRGRVRQCVPSALGVTAASPSPAECSSPCAGHGAPPRPMRSGRTSTPRSPTRRPL